MPAEPVSVAATAIMPSEIQQQIGMAAQNRVNQRRSLMRKLQLQGDIKPATALNLSPFRLRVRRGLINYEIPACKEGKTFSLLTVKNAITFPIYKGNTELSNKTVRQEWDTKAILPIEQLLEFKRAYDSDLGYEGVSQGGLVIFIGDEKELRQQNPTVQTAAYLQEGTERYLVYREEKLSDLLKGAEEQLYTRAMAELRQADTWFDQGDEARRNIQNTHHIWHDFSLRKQWIRDNRPWRHTEIRQQDCCERCGKQYVSKVGICACGFVREPLKAFLSGEIAADHVRMQTLTGEEWKKVREEEERRKKARG